MLLLLVFDVCLVLWLPLFCEGLGIKHLYLPTPFIPLVSIIIINISFSTDPQKNKNKNKPKKKKNRLPEYHAF